MSSIGVRPAPVRKPAFPEDGLPQVVQGKYKLRILWHLQDGCRRFGELRKELTRESVGTNGIAPRVLSRELKSLTELGLIHRRAYDVVPPKVEYRLTACGRSLLPVISKMREWGVRHPTRRNPIAKEARSARSEVVSAAM